MAMSLMPETIQISPASIFFLLGFSQALEHKYADGAGGANITVHVTDSNGFARFDTSCMNTPDAEASPVLVEVEAGNQHLEGCFAVSDGSWQSLDNRAKKRRKVGSLHGEIECRDPLTGGGKDNRKIELFFVRAEFGEEVEGLIYHPVGTSICTVNFVDDDNGFVSERKGFGGDETGLWHGAITGVHKENHAVYHAENALDFATEVGVSRRIHDIDFITVKRDGGVFGDNRNPALFLKVIRVHDALGDFLAGMKHVPLLKQSVNQGSFSMVDVGDNSDITYLVLRIKAHRNLVSSRPFRALFSNSFLKIVQKKGVTRGINLEKRQRMFTLTRSLILLMHFIIP